MLDVACGSLAAAIHLLPYLDEHRYWGVERNRAWLIAGFTIELPRAGVSRDRGYFLIDNGFELKGTPDCFDFAIANSVFAVGIVQRCRALHRHGVDPAEAIGSLFRDLVRKSGWRKLRTDRPGIGRRHLPRSRAVPLPVRVGESGLRRAGRARRTRSHDPSNPRGESVLAITRGAAPNP